MIMAGEEYMGTFPFKNVYFTGIVRDKLGRKMSKSLGNSPDPIELIEKFGADGVRMGMMLSAPAGNDILFDESLCEQGRNFNNKIWNAFRLVQGWEILFGIIIEERLLQFINKPKGELSVKLVTLLGISTEVRFEQPLNTPSSIEIILFGIITEVRLVQPEKA